MLCYTSHAAQKRSMWRELETKLASHRVTKTSYITLSLLTHLLYRAIGADGSECICAAGKQPVSVDQQHSDVILTLLL